MLSVLYLSLTLAFVHAIGKFSPDKMFGSGFEFEDQVKRASAGAPTEYNFTCKVDHFNTSSTSTFPLRYIVDKSNYDPATGPILFYTGNEGGIWAFYNNSGFVTTTLAQKWKAMVVFAEHRFYGTSMPFGNTTFADKNNLKFLKVEQVLWDYVDLLQFLKQQDPTLKNKATIAFGGSYGGVLSAWIRIKYPQHF